MFPPVAPHNKHVTVNKLRLAASQNLDPFTESEAEMPLSQQPATSHYPDPDDAIPDNHAILS